jgi:hypothetical protein
MDWSPDRKFGVPTTEEIADLTGREILQAIIERGGWRNAPALRRLLE